MSMIFRSTCMLGAMLASQALLAEEPVSAERPGFSSSSSTLAEGALQIETGYQLTHFGSGDVEAHTLPLGLLRYGLGDAVEVQVGLPGYTRISVPGADISGVTDMSVGLKWQISDRYARVPMAVYAGATLPTGADRLSSDNVVPTLALAWSYNPGIALFGTAVLASDDGDLSLGNGIGISVPVSATTGSYIESFSLFAEHTGPEHYLNAGFTFLPATRLQLDLHAGAGLNSRAADYFVGLGAAYRFR